MSIIKDLLNEFVDEENISTIIMKYTYDEDTLTEWKTIIEEENNDWEKISARGHSPRLELRMDKNKNYKTWQPTTLPLPLDFIRIHSQLLNWKKIVRFQKVTEQMIINNIDKFDEIDWLNILYQQELSPEFLEKYGHNIKKTKEEIECINNIKKKTNKLGYTYVDPTLYPSPPEKAPSNKMIYEKLAEREGTTELINAIYKKSFDDSREMLKTKYSISDVEDSDDEDIYVLIANLIE